MAEVAVVLPFYNTKPELLKQAVQSVLAQTFQDFELILINDGSSEWYDLTYCFDQKGRVHIISQSHRGVGCARNSGIMYSKAPYVAFLDSDDEWMPMKLEVQLKAMKAHPECALSHTSYFRIDDDRFDTIGVGYVSGNLYPWLGLRCQIATPTVMVKRDALLLQQFNESLATGEDSLLWLQIARQSPILGIPMCLSKVRIHEKPLVNKVASVARNMKWVMLNV